MRIFDEDGRDIWEVDEYGYLKNIIFNDQIDQIRIISDDGTVLFASKEFSLGTIVDTQNDVPSYESNLNNALIFKVTNQKASDDIFVFLALNTNVEWSEIQARGAEDNCDNFVGTNHSEISNNISSLIKNNGYSIDV